MLDIGIVLPRILARSIFPSVFSSLCQCGVKKEIPGEKENGGKKDLSHLNLRDSISHNRDHSFLFTTPVPCFITVFLSGDPQYHLLSELLEDGGENESILLIIKGLP